MKVSTLLPKVLKPLKKKSEGVLLELKLNWEKILGKHLGTACFVHSIKNINDKKILIIITENRNILELSYCSIEIKDKINNFFSYDLIDEIKFKKVLQY